MLFVNQKRGESAFGRPFMYFIRVRNGNPGYSTRPWHATLTWLPPKRYSDFDRATIFGAFWVWIKVAGDQREWEYHNPLELKHPVL